MKTVEEMTDVELENELILSSSLLAHAKRRPPREDVFKSIQDRYFTAYAETRLRDQAVTP